MIPLAPYAMNLNALTVHLLGGLLRREGIGAPVTGITSNMNIRENNMFSVIYLSETDGDIRVWQCAGETELKKHVDTLLDKGYSVEDYCIIEGQMHKAFATKMKYGFTIR